MTNPAYVYQTSNPAVIIVVPTLAESDVFPAPMPTWLSATDFNLTSVANSRVMREMRDAAGDAGVKLKNTKTCAYVANCDKFDTLES